LRKRSNNDETWDLNLNRQSHPLSRVCEIWCLVQNRQWSPLID
jgi:hypothetical protein